MTPFDSIKSTFGRNKSSNNSGEDPVQVSTVVDPKDEESPVDEVARNNVAEDAQHGVQAVEATTLVWSKGSLAAAFVLMWCVYLVNGFQSNVGGTLQPYAVSEWNAHSMITVISVVTNCMMAAVYIPLSKILDVWGRAEGFLLMAALATTGMGLMAGSGNLATYCVANVFWQVGWSGLIYSIDVITADSTKLHNRGLAYAFTSSPYMITAFAGPKSAEAFLNGPGWRWGFGAFTIILPVVAAPMYLLLKWNLHKAKKRGLLVAKHTESQSILQTLKWGFIEFDIAGSFLFAAGLIIFLVPFNIAESAPQGWRTPYIIAMIVVGFVLLVLFGLWERFVAPVPFFKYDLLVDRTVLGVCLLDFIYMIAYSCWAGYFSSFLQVVNNLPPSEAGWIDNTFTIVSGVLLFLVGWSMSKTGRFKWLLVVGIPLYVFSQGLMIHFRQPGQSIGYLIMCEVLISIAGATFILCMQVGLLAAVDHQYVATGLAVLSVTGSVGGAVGSSISGAIWTNTFQAKLADWLPADALDNLDYIAGDLSTQLSYPVGSEVRKVIQRAYGYGQARMLGVGTGVMALAFVTLFMIRNYDLRKMHQTKGTVF
ncbi:major facilitator superfamily domain-containing protein [Emericellopsis atlantica]|uniref:Major facilitator superfamily domain-containing protein n=1 Tax=Emericellopsis atlantica TaxID=2614577 RepID=A0A9P8CM14_9HYPO|nr:major facilitator superfamily domain-containing protein [Emericellopsis atlantica]KAG9251595.1 major facilitator superfamily domain-containing protein [Emericellopsis atlantica]